MVRDGSGFDDFNDLRPLEMLDPDAPSTATQDGSGIRESTLHDPALRARLARLAPRVSVEAALAATHAAANRRRWMRRLVPILGAAAALLLLVLVISALSSDDADVLASGDGGSTSTTAASSDPNGTSGDDGYDEEDLPEFTGTFVPGSYVPSFTVPSGSAPSTTASSTTTESTTPTTAPVRPPSGDVKLTVIPQGASSTTVGDRLLVEVQVENLTGAPIAVRTGSASCPMLGTVTAGPTADPDIPSGAGTPFTGQGAQVQDQFGGNRLGSAWRLVPPGLIGNTAGCSPDGSAQMVDAGGKASSVVGFDADAAPGPLAAGSLVISARVDYWPSEQEAIDGAGSKKTLSATANVPWNDVSARIDNASAVYAAVNTHPDVRSFLDGAEGDPERTFVLWAGFHGARWEFRFSPTDGGGNLTACADAGSAAVSIC